MVKQQFNTYALTCYLVLPGLWSKYYCEIKNIFFQFRSTCIVLKTTVSQESKWTWHFLKKCSNSKKQVSLPTSLKRIPPGVGDVPQDRPSGPLLIKPKPAIKNSLRKSSRNYAIALELVRALLILTVLGCISDYHVDALPIKKHDTCGKLFFLQS